MVEPSGNRQNEYTKKATKTEMQEWVEEYVYEVLNGEEVTTFTITSADDTDDDDPIVDPDPPETRLVSIKFLNDSGTEYIDPRDENGNFIEFGEVVTEKDGKVYVNVKAQIQDARDKQTVEYWKVQLDGGVVRERQEVKKFTYKNLEPDKEYTTLIRSFNKNNKGIGNSGPIRFKTKLANTGERPPPVTNLQAVWDGFKLRSTWDYETPPRDFNNFIFAISNTDESLKRKYGTVDTSFSLDKQNVLPFITPITLEVKVTVWAKNNRGMLSDPVSITVTESCLPPVNNPKLEAAVLGYIVSWDQPEEEAYQATLIYESDSENGEYQFAYSSYTSPIFVPSTNFTPRFIKVGNASFTGKVCDLVATTPKSVTPINPVSIDTTAPGIVTNASATFNGSTYELIFDKPSDSDLRDFIITLVGTSPDGSSTRTTFLSASEVNQQKFQLTIDENKNFFGSPKNNIVASIKARDLTSNVGEAVENISASFTDEPDIPINVNFVPGILSYTATWDEPTYGLYENSRVYESSTENGTYNLVSFGKTPLIVFTNSSDSRWVKVSHTSIFGAESEKTAAVLVTPINPVSVDTVPPDQRTDISYTPGVSSVDISWTNPSGDNNLDIAGITVRYAKTSDSSNYTWVDVPFDASNLITSVTINNLLPLTSYDFCISTFDKTQNRTEYSNTSTQITLGDTSPSPRPVAPTVTVGTSAGGPMVVLVSQDSIEHGTLNPLPLDIQQIQVFVLDSGQSSSPAPGVSSNTNASLIGTFPAAYNGSINQEKFYVPLQDGEQRYFYTRVVDSSGNISDASEAVQSSAMSVFNSAYISSLTADKIATGTLTAGRYIDVGPTSSNRIRIENTSGGVGRIFSGLSPESGGGWNDTDSGFYMDSDGKFSLKDRLSWNPSGLDPITGAETGLLAIKGSIEAQSGSFTGNVRVTDGSLYAGSSPDSGQRLILNSSGITGYNSSGSNKFTLTTEGRLTAQLGTVGGWTISDTTLSSSNVTIDSTNKRIIFGSSNQLILGQDVGGTGKHGLYIDANDFIYGDGTFSLGNGNITWNGSTLNVTGSGTFNGSINASSGSITGPLQIGANGYLYAGASATSGARVVMTSAGIAGYSNETGNPSVFILTPSSSSLSGWSINSSSIEKTAGVSPLTYTIKLDSANSQITAGNSTSTVGIKANISGSIAMWAGTQSPSTSSPFYVTNTGVLSATNMLANGIELSGGFSVVNPSYTRYVGGSQFTPGSAQQVYAVYADDGKDLFFKSSGGDPSKIRWLDASSRQRGTVGWETSEEQDGTANYSNTMVIRANAVAGEDSGKILIHAQGPGASINLKTGEGGEVTINGAQVETPTTIKNRYKNGIGSQAESNQITYGTMTASTANPNPQPGDVHLRY